MARFVAIAVVLLGLVATAATQPGPPARVGEVLPAWTPGTLDIHEIATGRGNSALLIYPDGTTLLIDAGDAGETAYADPRPDGSRTPAEWIARYVTHMLAGRDARLDYALVTHFHPDHIGVITGKEPLSTTGGYRLSGITDVGDRLPIGTVIDRGYDYQPPPTGDQMFANYRKFLDAQVASRRLQVVHAVAGRVDQLAPRHGGTTAAPFAVRIIAANNLIWTGQGDAARVRFPPLDQIPVADDRPNENMCSIALRVSYGPFDLFSGGDMPGYPVPGAAAWHDLETDVARVIGPTDVHIVNHHEKRRLQFLQQLSKFFLGLV